MSIGARTRNQMNLLRLPPNRQVETPPVPEIHDAEAL